MTLDEHDKNERSGEEEKEPKPPRPKKDKSSARADGRNWTIKITAITFLLAALFSLMSEVASAKANLVIAGLLLLFLITISIVFDGVAVSVTSCDLPPLLACASRKIAGAKTAIRLVKNAEKVSNICADVIGDICGIVSGACTIAIVAKIEEIYPEGNMFVVAILLSSVVAALTVGGKAYVKGFAIKNSKEMVLFVARLIPFGDNKDKSSKSKRDKKQNDEKKPKKE